MNTMKPMVRGHLCFKTTSSWLTGHKQSSYLLKTILSWLTGHKETSYLRPLCPG